MTASRDSRLAVDVALVPPDWVQQRAREINARLCAERPALRRFSLGGPEGFRFDATHRPHSSLVQQFVRRENLSALMDRLDSILHGAPPLSLRVLRVASCESTVSFLLDRTPNLLRLHERLMDAAQPVEEPTGAAEAFFADGEPARQSDVEWVARYRSHASFSHFIPHITLGFGTAPEPGDSFDFLADRVGLFHLGRCCTCRLLLHAWALVGSA